jgi:hypothetical protein
MVRKTDRIILGNNLLEKFGGLENVWENVWGKLWLKIVVNNY